MFKKVLRQVQGWTFSIERENENQEYMVIGNKHVIGFAESEEEAEEIIEQFIGNRGVGNIEFP